MKKFSKILSVALLVALVLSLGVANAFAQTITIDRDNSWKATEDLKEGESNVATYTWYKLFDATVTTSATVNADGTSTGGVAVYTISGTGAAAKVGALDSDVFNADLAADGKYYITVKDGVGDAAVIAALKSMDKTLFDHDSVTSSDNPVKIENLDAGYYFIEASNGKDVIVQTLDDVRITEKNDYPTIDKKQRKDNGDYKNDTLPVEIGSYIDYQVTVDVPNDVNKPIAVIDIMSSGLEFDKPAGTDGLTVTYPEGVTNGSYSAMTSTDPEYVEGATWQIKFPTAVVEACKGKSIVITFRAKVTAAALQDTGKENEVTLNYDEGHYILKDKVEYELYFGGIEKVDGASVADGKTPADKITLEGVKFEVTVGDDPFNVTPVTKGGEGEDKDEVLYYIPGGDSNEVVTGKNGLIIIRGLDGNKTYTLTETETQASYNLLKTPKNLTLVPDTDLDGTVYPTATYDQVLNNRGTVLPSTGGIGTTIFYVVGGVLVLAAIILLVTKKRMSE